MKRFFTVSLVYLIVLSFMLCGCDVKKGDIKSKPTTNLTGQKELEASKASEDKEASKAPEDKEAMKATEDRLATEDKLATEDRLATEDKLATEDNEAKEKEAMEVSEATKAPEDKVIRVMSCTGDVVKALKTFQSLHPDFNYKIETTYSPLMDVSMEITLDKALAAGGIDAPDIYAVDSSYAAKYIRGEASHYAAAYKDLGIDVDRQIEEASIAKYLIELGTNTEGELVGLSYQSTAGVFIYRRSIAKKVWGTDDPSSIKTIIGPGWDKFLTAAADLKAKGYHICPSTDDILQAATDAVDRPWVVDGKLIFDPEREKFIDFAVQLKKKWVYE